MWKPKVDLRSFLQYLLTLPTLSTLSTLRQSLSVNPNCHENSSSGRPASSKDVSSEHWNCRLAEDLTRHLWVLGVWTLSLLQRQVLLPPRSCRHLFLIVTSKLLQACGEKRPAIFLPSVSQPQASPHSSKGLWRQEFWDRNVNIYRQRGGRGRERASEQYFHLLIFFKWNDDRENTTSYTWEWGSRKRMKNLYLINFILKVN